MMNKLNLLVLILFCCSISACAQKEFKLKATALSDTIVMGKSVKVRLSLEGIESDIFKGREKTDKDVLDGFFGDYQQNHDFRTFVTVSPNSLGKNSLGPYKIKLLGKEFTSNKVSVEVIEQPEEIFKIEMPKEGKVGEQIKIKIIGNSNGSFTALVKENEIFKVHGSSISTSVTDGVYSCVSEYTLILKKKGAFEFDRSLFKNLPDQIKLESVKFEVK